MIVNSEGIACFVLLHDFSFLVRLNLCDVLDFVSRIEVVQSTHPFPPPRYSYALRHPRVSLRP